MASEPDTLPLDEWLKLSDGELAERQRRLAEQEAIPEPNAPVEHQDAVSAVPHTPKSYAQPREAQRTSTLDEVHGLAKSLTHLHQLKLVARLWSSLPPTFRYALIQLQLEDIQSPVLPVPPGVLSDSSRQSLRRFLFDRTHTSELYSAPRRFDLATIFVVTAAYSLLLGGLTALDMGPLVKVVAIGLTSIVAAGQALFHNQANPRGVSVLVGASAYTLLFFIIWCMYPRGNPFFLTVVINGIVFGSFLGYIAGVLVGGIFLVADRLRGMPSPQATDAIEATGSVGSDSHAPSEFATGSQSSPKSSSVPSPGPGEEFESPTKRG